MNQKYDNINDSEIRVISSETNSQHTSNWRKRNKRILLILLATSVVAIIFGICVVVLNTSYNQEPDIIEKNITVPSYKSKVKGYVEMTDTIINGIPLSVFSPRNSVAKLQIGTESLQDTSAILVTQAADVRKDNGEIVGAYVSEGNLLSKGQSKSGFCAIINGTPIIGISDATPYLEQAIETNGFFFRQYPLVVGGQIVENKPKGKSVRKALAEWKGEIVVVISKRNLTFHEFSQLLADMGVSNAIYLVGSSSFGFAIDASGNRIEFGNKEDFTSKNTNYIVWE